MSSLEKVIQASGFFDEKWYVENYPDVKAGGWNALQHYLKYGWKMGRDPSSKFSTQQYLDKYPKIKNSGKNPLVDYVMEGRGAGRSKFPSAFILPEIAKSRNDFQDKDLPLLSIVMPVFNVGPYLDASILSARYQNYQNFELIVVNDASTDNCKEIIEMHAELDSRVKLINLEHNTLGGAGIPSNLGMEQASGKYIGFIDSDDWVTADGFEKLIEAAEQSDADIVIGGFDRFADVSRDYSQAYDIYVSEKIPTNVSFTAREYPDVFRLSPVPWRKLYKKSYLDKNSIKYPEGDFFFEDNPLHWFALSSHSKIVKINEIISYHRLERIGQTTFSADYKMAAMCNHINTIGGFLSSHIDMPGDQPIANEFLDYCYRCYWVAERQDRADVSNLIGKRLANIAKRYWARYPSSEVRSNFKNRFEMLSKNYPDLDLSVVIPVHDCEELIVETLDSLLSMNGISFNILVMDDGSADRTKAICESYESNYENVHVFSQGNKGAGKARNGLIPLCTGKYTYFLDADDALDAPSLALSVKEAVELDTDLLFIKYKISFYEKKTVRAMFDPDAEIWARAKGISDITALKKLSAKLINYPWNRLIKTDLLHDKNIFFGGTVVHNDIQFHWSSILHAKNIHFSDHTVCTHRKFDNRSQITNITDSRRLQAFGVLDTMFHDIKMHEHGGIVMESWKEFSTKLVKWLKDRIPDDHQEIYASKKESFLSSLTKI